MQIAVSIMAAVGLFFANGVSAAHTLKFINHCAHDMYVWPIGNYFIENQIPETNAGYTHIPPFGGSVILDMGPNDKTSFKMRDRPHYVPAPKGIVQAEIFWQTDIRAIWYDISAINCGHGLGTSNPSFCPFLPGGVKLWFLDADPEICPVSYCTNVADCSKNPTVYQHEGPYPFEPSFRCDEDYDAIFEACVYGHSPQSAPGPEDEDYAEGPSDGYNQPSSAPPAPTAEPEPESDCSPSHTGACGWHTYPYRMPAHTLSLTRPPARPESTAPAHCYTPRPEAKTYPVPAGYPAKIMCWNAECTCRTASKEDAAWLPPNDPDSCPHEVLPPECKDLMRG
jgi:hypothetical protein